LRAARVNLAQRLIASLLHELSQPLMVTRANADAAIRLLRKPNADSREVGDALDDVVVASERAADLLSEARTMAFDTTVCEAVDLNTIVRQVCDWFAREAEHKNVRFTLDLGAATMLVDANASQIRQVIAELLANALDASAPVATGTGEMASGEVAVRTARSKSRVALSIANNGSGANEAQQGRIFDPFYSTKPGGLGLGLWAAQRIAAGLGGSLEATRRSTPGMTFRLELPAATPQRENGRRQRV